MVEPTIVVVVDEEESRRSLERTLSRRFGADYRVLCLAAPDHALQRLADLRRDGGELPIIMADLWLPGMDGLAFLTRARDVLPAAKRILLVDFSDSTAADKIVEGMEFGLFDRVLTKQGFPAEEWLYPTISEFLADWSRSTSRPRFEAVRVIGEQWSARSHVLRDLLSRNSIPFGFYEATSEAGRRFLTESGLDDSRLPVVISFSGQALIEPTTNQVAAMLGVQLEPEPGHYDLAIVGGGPAGLSAAVYGASEGLRTIVVEPQALGGQAGTSSMIRNYLGFPEGISGARLAQAAAQQGRFFGASWVYDEVVALRSDGRSSILVLEDGAEIACRAVVIATGVAYRRLEIPALEALVGAGVFYGAAIAEASALHGQAVVVVGAGNSAGQAAVHLATRARRVTMVVRGESLTAGMSDYLIKQIEATDNIVVRSHTQVVDGGGAGRLEWITLADTVAGIQARHHAAALFVLIGAEPRTGWLAGIIERDPGGYILTGRDLHRQFEPERGWPPDRGPGLLETSVPGVFAAGDVRHGSTKRVATAVGDGALAVRLVHEFLAETTTVHPAT